jgi:hypothetical protein
MRKKSPYPKCIYCGCKATRWDGGECYSQLKEEDGKIKLRSGYIYWLCKKHDPRHKFFDLPDTLPEAIREIVHLRVELQKMHAKMLLASS